MSTTEKTDSPATESRLDSAKLSSETAIVAIVAMVALLHGAGLWVPFVWDDESLIQFNVRLLTPWKIWVTPLFGEGGAGDYYRPLPFFIFSMVGIIAGLEHAFPYHLATLLGIVATAVLVLKLAEHYLDRLSALAVTFAFLVFPAGIESFAWLSAFPDVCVLAFFAGFLLRFERRSAVHAQKFDLGLFLLAAGAIFSKESGIAVIFLALAVDWRNMLAAPASRLKAVHLPLWGLGIGYMLIRTTVLGGGPSSALDLGLALKTAGAYFLKLLYPLPTAILIDDRTPGADWRSIVGLAGIAGLSALLFISKRRLIQVGAALLLAGLLPYLNLFPPKGEAYLIAERYMLPMALGALFITTGLVKSLQFRRAVPVLLIALASVWLPFSVMRYGDWRNPERLWLSQVEAYPNKIFPWLHLAKARYDAEQYVPAREAALHALQLWEDYNRTYRIRVDAAYEAGLYLAAVHAHEGTGQFAVALEYLERVRAVDDSPATYLQEIKLHDRALDFQGAFDAALRGVAVHPNHPEITERAVRMAVLGDRSQALKTIEAKTPFPIGEYVSQLGKARAEMDTGSLFERGRKFAEADLLSLAFPLFQDGKRGMTADELNAVADLAFENHLWFEAEQFYRASLSDGDGKLPQLRLGLSLLHQGNQVEGCRHLSAMRSEMRTEALLKAFEEQCKQ